MQKLEQLASYLQLNEIDSLPQLKIIQQKTTLKPSIVVILISALLLLISIFIDLSPLILTVVAVIIPGYLTFQVIGTKVQTEYIKYTIYWITFGLMEVLLEPIVTLIFGAFFLIIIETIVVVALLHPKFNMSLILYDRVIRLYVLKQENVSINISKQTKSQSQQQSKTQPERQAFIGVSPVKQQQNN